MNGRLLREGVDIEQLVEGDRLARLVQVESLEQIVKSKCGMLAQPRGVSASRVSDDPAPSEAPAPTARHAARPPHASRASILDRRGPDGEDEDRSAAAREPKDPAAGLEQACLRYVEFCLEYPAFMECALSLMQRPADGLREQVSDGVWVRLGQALAACVGRLERILAVGAERGVFAIEDPAFTANLLYTQMLGSMQLARIGAGVSEVAPGVAATFELKPERVRDACVVDVLAVARNAKGTSA